MDDLKSGFPYTPHRGAPGVFAFNTNLPNAQCQKCCHSSALIAALWERISELEGRIYRVSAEKHTVEDVVRSVLRLQNISLESHERPSKQGVRDHEESGHTYNNIHESFNSCDTLVESSPVLERSASESLNVIDQPLIDLSGHYEAAFPEDPTNKSDSFKPQPQAISRYDPPSDQFHKYIHHFQSRSPQLEEAQKPPNTLSIPNPAATQLIYVSSDEADSESTSDPSVYVSASTSFSDSFMEHKRRENVTVDATNNATIKKNLERDSTTRTLSQATGKGLEASFWASPQKSHDVKNGVAIGVSRAIEMAVCNNYSKTPRLSSVSPSQEVQYRPGATDRNLHRQVVISGLQASCSLCRVLENVRGGLVIEAILVNTINITKTKSAVISFFEERSAMAYAQYVNEKLSKIDGQKIIATLIPTPSWPLPLMLKRAIREQHLTRCLEIQDFPCDVTSSMLRGDLEMDSATKLDMIEHMERVSSTATLRFCSVKAARQAFGNLSSRGRYGRCRLRYALDPCTLPFSQVN